MGGVGNPASRPSPRPALTASVSWLRCSRSRLCARSSSRWRSVTSLSCLRRARSSEEGALLAEAWGGGPEPARPAPWRCPHSPCGPERSSLRRRSFSSRSRRSSASACCADTCSWGGQAVRARLPPALRGARGKGGDSLSLGPAPRQPFPEAPASAPRAAPAWPPPPARSGAPAPLAPCPGPRLDGTRALRPSLTPGPLEVRSCAPQALPSWSPCSQKVKSCDNRPLPTLIEAGKSQTVPAQEAVHGSRGRGRSDRGGATKRKDLGKEVVPWAPWALSCSSPQGHRKEDCLLPARRPRAEAQGSKWSLLSIPPHSAQSRLHPRVWSHEAQLGCQVLQATGEVGGLSLASARG